MHKTFGCLKEEHSKQGKSKCNGFVPGLFLEKWRSCLGESRENEDRVEGFEIRKDKQGV